MRIDPTCPLDAVEGQRRLRQPVLEVKVSHRQTALGATCQDHKGHVLTSGLLHIGGSGSMVNTYSNPDMYQLFSHATPPPDSGQLPNVQPV